MENFRRFTFYSICFG